MNMNPPTLVPNPVAGLAEDQPLANGPSAAAPKQPLVSVIIPTFNAGALIGQCLDSVLCQQPGLVEVVVVDGASRDDTLQVVQRYAAQHPQLRWVSAPDQGIYDAMNKGLDLARGEWVFFLGADDGLYEASTVAQLAPHLLPEFDLVYGDIFRVAKQRREGEVVSLDRLLVQNICHQAALYRRTFLLQQVGHYNLDYRIYADWDLNIRCYAAQARTHYVPQIIARYDGRGFSSATTDMVFMARRHVEVARLFGVSLWHRVLRPCRYQFREEALAHLQQRRYGTAARLYGQFAWHAVMAKLD